jgi:hypothetical protein
MPRPQHTKAKEEHLIFVKNCPADLATGPLLDLFERYDPIRIKNVYPNSDITTVVVSFPTYDEACYAQEDTDGIRLENVVLRVEMFDKYRSVRYLREERGVNRPLGAVGDDDDEVGYIAPKYSLEAEDFPDMEPAAPAKQGNGGNTWAQIARKVHPSGMAPLPAPRAVTTLKHPAAVNESPSATKATIATTNNAPTEPARADRNLPDSPRTSSTELTGFEEEDSTPNGRAAVPSTPMPPPFLPQHAFAQHHLGSSTPLPPPYLPQHAFSPQHQPGYVHDTLRNAASMSQTRDPFYDQVCHPSSVTIASTVPLLTTITMTGQQRKQREDNDSQSRRIRKGQSSLPQTRQPTRQQEVDAHRWEWSFMGSC